MAVSVSGTLQLLANIIDSRTLVSGASNEAGQRTMSINSQVSIASGTGPGQLDRVWSDTRTVADGGTSSIDLAGVLTDAFGATTTFVKLRGLIVVAGSGNTTLLSAARPAAAGSVLFSAASDALAGVSFGGWVLAWVDLQAGVTVAAGSTDLVSIINSSGAIATFTIIALGTSA
jgi:hypothetical protein